MTAKLGASVVALGLALLLTTISATRAADQTITLTLGTGSALALERPFRTVLIGDPNVVNVHAHNDRSVILEPLNLGATNLVFVDERSIAITNVRILVYETSASRINYRDVAEIDDRQASRLDKILNGANAGELHSSGRPVPSSH
jgi:Flp pilus assembly secretin CpaC